MSEEDETANKTLYPVFKALRAKQHAHGHDEVTLLKKDRLFVNGKVYGVENLGELPAPYNLDSLFNVTKNGVNGFFREYSKLSNHHKCTFKVEDFKVYIYSFMGV